MLKRYPHKVLMLVTCLSLLPVFLLAQETKADGGPSDVTAPEVSEPEPAPGLQISGFIDAYYQNSFTKTVFPTSFTPNDKSFSLGMANLVLAKEGKVGFVADIAFGPRAEAANGYAGTALSFIKQMYVRYAATERLTLTLGNFGTHVGYEVIDSKSNFNYSTSYMFSFGPFFHTGIKANLALGEKFGAMLGVFNDTDTKIDVVRGKHLGAQFSYSDDRLSAYINYIGGRISDFSDAKGEIFAHQVDLTAVFQATEALGLGLNSTVKKVVPIEGIAQSWSGMALYAKYAFGKTFSLGARGEFIQDADGLILGLEKDHIAAFTLSGNIYLGNLTVIPEFRLDSASKTGAYTNFEGNPLRSASGLMLAAVYSF
ncbi:MAG: hypothetical protein RL386_1464 [Bacteroidota bacterium]|jgi:hypothetical protein